MQMLIRKRLLNILLILSALTLSNYSVTYAQEESSVEQDYAATLNNWNNSGMNSTQLTSAISADFNENESTGKSVSEGDREGYSFNDRERLSFTVTVPEEGLYQLGLTYFSESTGLIQPEFALKVNDEFQFLESRRFVVPTKWQYVSDTFETNRFGNELIPKQTIRQEWQTVLLRDANYEQEEPLLFYLKEGTSQITIENTSGEMLVGNVFVASPEEKPSYTEYVSLNPNQSKPVSLLQIVEAEKPLYKSESSIRPIPKKNVSTSPYSAESLLLNTMGGESWNKSGQSITWEVEAEEAGWYHLSLKTMQDQKQDIPVFRTVLIDGEVPFQEMQHYRIEPSEKWTNMTLAKDENDPYAFYLEPGIHEVTLIADATLIANIVNDLEFMMRDVGNLGLKISQLTGNQSDSNRDWDILQYLPEIKEQFQVWDAMLADAYDQLHLVYGKKEVETTEETRLKLIRTQLDNLGEEPNELPNRLGDLSEGSSSATQLMGDLITSLQNTPLLVDSLYLHTADESLPEANADFFTTAKSKVHEFFLSFNQQTFGVEQVDDDTLEVWVARSQQFVEVMQNMADSSFTEETGVKVKFSVMPNEQKLILSNSAGKQPDVALGISVGTPYELSIRGAATDISQFNDFEEVAERFSPGAFLPLMMDGGVYALPETQDFYVLYYRSDIMEQLNIPIPNTWEEVTQILPELQRSGMNFFVPLSGTAGSKPFMFTAPFIYQFGGEVYSLDAMSAAIDSEESVAGLDFMTKLYTLYSLPMQVPNFYNSFRYGTLPIGISNFQTYVQLRSAAPEIANSWDIAPHPGIEQEDGEVVRWTPGSAQTSMIFNKSEKQDEGWEFMKWWTSTETQVDFATNMQTTFGPEYMWHTANLEAFSLLPWPREDKEVILEQWEYLREVPKIPGSYMIEREVSNVWTDVVFNGVNLRASVDDATVTSNREIRRKMEEFQYVESGEVVKPYQLPTLQEILDWGKDK